MQSELPTDSEEVRGFAAESQDLGLEQVNSVGFVGEDAADQEFLDFGSPEDQAHDQVVYILVFYELAAVVCGEQLEVIDPRDDPNHELHEHTGFIDDGLEVIARQPIEIIAEMDIDGLEESTVGVLLEHLRPLEE